MVNKKLVAVGVGAGAAVAAVLIGRKLLSKSGEPPAAPTTIDLTFAKTAADAVATQKSLNRNAPGDEGKFDRLRYFFLHRRAVALGLADATLRVAPGLAQLQQRISLQSTKVEQFLAPLVGTLQARGPYFGAARDTKPAHHLDLGFYVHVRAIDPPASSEAAAVAAASPNPQEAQTLRELDVRKMRVSTIVWRATAIDADLWSGTGDTATLRETELLKLLDRRLRSVERLHYEVSAGATEERIFQDVPFSNASPRSGPWVDGFLVHAFERPSLPRSARSVDGSWAAEDFILGFGRLVHRLNVFGATGGTFTITFNGETSVDIPFDASKDQVRGSIRSIPALDGTVQIDCSEGPLSTDPVRINLEGFLKPGDKLTVDGRNLTGNGQEPPVVMISDPSLVFEAEIEATPRFNLVAPSLPGQPHNPGWYFNRTSDELDWNTWPGTRLVDDKSWKRVPDSRSAPGYGWRLLPIAFSQSLSISGSPQGGGFKLNFGGQATREIGYLADAASVKNALAALPGLAQKIIVTGGPLPDAMTLYFHESVPFDATLTVSENTIVVPPVPSPPPTPPPTPTELLLGVRQGFFGRKPGEIVEELFALIVSPSGGTSFNRRDWWNRSWLHADGMMAALHIEALRFALMRHAPTGPGLRFDDEFDALPWKHSLTLDDCFELRQVVRPADSIMAPGKNDYFDNGATALDDLQVGDQVIFADSPVLTALGRTSWDYPTLLVTDVDTSVDKAGVNLSGLKVQGFGSDELSLPDFQLLQAGITDEVLKRVQAYIPAELARLKVENPSATPPDRLSWDIGILTQLQQASVDDTVLRRWSPYGDTFDEPGPWWLCVNIHATLWRKVFNIHEEPFVDPDT
ncbi:MAG: hypothetical protein ABW190_15110, partial [Rhizobacter sp.]